MLLSAVMDELGTALATIPGLRVFPYWTRSIKPPAAIVFWPDPLNFDATMGRGGDRFDMPVMIAVGNVDSRSSRDELAAYLDGRGKRSIKRVIDDHQPIAYHSARVKSAQVAVVTVNAVDFLAATFHVDIIGRGD